MHLGKLINFKKIPYTWPEKKDFITALQTWIKYKNTKDKNSFEKEINETLYFPFKENKRPHSVEQFSLIHSDLEDLNLDFVNFMIALSEICKTLPCVDIEINHHIKNDMDFFIKISLIKKC